MNNNRYYSNTPSESNLTQTELDVYEMLADDYDDRARPIYCHIGASHLDKDILRQSISEGLNPDLSIPWTIIKKPPCGLWGKPR